LTRSEAEGDYKGSQPLISLLTNTDYNSKADHFCGLPITSKKQFKSQEFLAKYGLDITNDDIEGNLYFEKESFFLCDRPVRLDEQDLSKVQKHTGKIKSEKLELTITKVSRFLRSGKIN